MTLRKVSKIMASGDGLTEQRYCYFYPYIIIFFVGYQFTGLMTMVVSLDRLFAVLFPMKHVTRQIKHYLWIIIAALAYCFIGYFVVLPFQLQSTKPVSWMCYTSAGFILPVWRYLLSFRIITVGISIVVYIPIAIKTKKVSGIASERFMVIIGRSALAYGV
ncbi:hypothetical protein L596_016190 [Steinernema carpocapsae]|uniref:G-protein coupled receptors family 1 profile domain-containing protein n=1 Tax=Steinernema carpocapsae TaxID=34508 RepID=A0A4U5NI82_STECR|nr:hypothetical protein L596_016190 [Steinernema carpocapsae]